MSESSTLLILRVIIIMFVKATYWGKTNSNNVVMSLLFKYVTSLFLKISTPTMTVWGNFKYTKFNVVYVKCFINQIVF